MCVFVHEQIIVIIFLKLIVTNNAKFLNSSKIRNALNHSGILNFNNTILNDYNYVFAAAVCVLTCVGVCVWLRSNRVTPTGQI